MRTYNMHHYFSLAEVAGYDFAITGDSATARKVMDSISEDVTKAGYGDDVVVTLGSWFGAGVARYRKQAASVNA